VVARFVESTGLYVDEARYRARCAHIDAAIKTATSPPSPPLRAGEGAGG
jgi:hypothetical protein